MNRHLLRTALLVALLLLGALTGCGSGEDTPETVVVGGSTARETVERPWGEVPVIPEMEKAESPEAADHGFIAAMLPHHEQALELAGALLAFEEADERIRAAANFIEHDQRQEIEVMSGWLEAWELPADDGVDHSTMPGMIAPDRLAGISQLPVEAAQVEFLTLMIEHHQGAVDMSRSYLAEAVNTYTLSVARHVIREQELEIGWMERLIGELCTDGSIATCPGS